MKQTGKLINKTKQLDRIKLFSSIFPQQVIFTTLYRTFTKFTRIL